MRRISLFLLIALTGFSLAACSGKGSESGKTPNAGQSQDFSPVIAEVAGIPITRAYFDYRYETLPPREKARFSGEGWEQRFAKRLTEEILMTRAAEDENLPMVREVEWELEKARRVLLYDFYTKEHYGDSVPVPEEEVVRYYEADPDAYRTRGRIFAHHIQCASESKIREAAAKLAAGEHWDRVCAEYNEDPATQDNAGQLGWFNPDGYVIGMGFNSEFTSVAYELDANTVSDPIKIGDAWHIIRTGGKVPGEIRPLEDVRDEIEAALRPGIGRELFEKGVTELRLKYGAKYFGEFASIETRTDEQLYRAAVESRDGYAKIGLYDKLVEMYPDSKLADESLFMSGFVHSEEYGDVGMAAVKFRKLRTEYPDSEFLKDAEWMLQHLGRAAPELHDEGLPNTAAEANQRIGELRTP